ncbi:MULTISPECIES: fimbria/pilus periplasmic chaperone [Cupriavidus]
MRLWKIGAFLAVMVLLPAQAAVVITGTRVVYPEQSREVNVRLTNVESAPVLVQAWIDDGDVNAQPDEIQVPFVLTPPVFRMEPKKGQTLRVMYAGENAPPERESLYWLNVLEIPPTAHDAASRNLLQFAFRTRIKLFYRPAVLEEDPTAVRGRLKWQLVPGAQGANGAKGGPVLRVHNPTPYHISFSRVALKSGEREVSFNQDMVAPFGHHDFERKPGEPGLTKAAAQVSYGVLNDYGAEVKDTAMAEAAETAETAETVE